MLSCPAPPCRREAAGGVVLPCSCQQFACNAPGVVGDDDDGGGWSGVRSVKSCEKTSSTGGGEGGRAGSQPLSTCEVRGAAINSAAPAARVSEEAEEATGAGPCDRLKNSRVPFSPHPSRVPAVGTDGPLDNGPHEPCRPGSEEWPLEERIGSRLTPSQPRPARPLDEREPVRLTFARTTPSIAAGLQVRCQGQTGCVKR